MKRIVWLGPMGSDEISMRAMEMAQFFLDPTCKEFGFSFYFPQVPWSRQLADRASGRNPERFRPDLRHKR